MLRKKADAISFARDMIGLRKPLRLRGRWKRPKDGLYRIATSRKVHGGVLIHDGRVKRCSPAVRRKIHIWMMSYAEYVGDPFAVS
jgi:hypothetical protein